MVKPGNTNWRGRLSTNDLLIKVTCFKKSKSCLNYRKQLILTSWYKEVNCTELYPSVKVSWLSNSLNHHQNSVVNTVSKEGSVHFSWVEAFYNCIFNPYSWSNTCYLPIRHNSIIIYFCFSWISDVASILPFPDITSRVTRWFGKNHPFFEK